MDYKAVLKILDLADKIATTTSTGEFIKIRKEMQKKLEAMNDEYHDLECSYLELKAAEDTRKMLSFDYHDDDPTYPRLEAKHAFDAMFDGFGPDDLPFPDVEDLAPAEEVEGSDE